MVPPADAGAVRWRGAAGTVVTAAPIGATGVVLNIVSPLLSRLRPVREHAQASLAANDRDNTEMVYGKSVLLGQTGLSGYGAQALKSGR